MILYLDTSALVKAYIQETHSEHVISAMQGAEAVAAHWIAYVEAYAAFGRLSREGLLDMTQLADVQQKFENDWESYLRLEIEEPQLRHAARLVQKFGLRAYDSVHLAAAEWLLAESGEMVTFACFDKRLNDAAVSLGLTTLPSAE